MTKFNLAPINFVLNFKPRKFMNIRKIITWYLNLKEKKKTINISSTLNVLHRTKFNNEGKLAAANDSYLLVFMHDWSFQS